MKEIMADFIKNSNLFSGCGSELSVYDLSTNVLEAKINAFSGSSIHGFREGK